LEKGNTSIAKRKGSKGREKTAPIKGIKQKNA